ncbi:MAG: MOSC domain-containing protein [Burkholderiaceae bacterium]|nr:MOSC domain-containing protein [Burkholderiaceae bacterium]
MGNLLSINLGQARPLMTGGRKILSAIGKQAVEGGVAVNRLGLDGDEQADLSVHGGIDKAVYAYPVEHHTFWQKQRKTHGVSLFDEVLPPGFVGENLSISGLLEHEVWVGDELHFPDCILRVTAPREPCFKFNAVMGYNQAAKDMALAGCCGFYMAVDKMGSMAAGQTFHVVAGRRSLSITQAFAAKWAKHAR